MGEVEDVRAAIDAMRCPCCNVKSHLRKIDPWDGRLDGWCDDCATARCDAFPGACSKART